MPFDHTSMNPGASKSNETCQRGGKSLLGTAHMHLYIGNLSRSVTENDLDWIFSGVGEIVFARLVNSNSDATARGYAFVHIAVAEHARAAAAGLNGSYLKGLRLIVRPVVDHARHARVLQAAVPYPLRPRAADGRTGARPKPEAAI